MDDRASNQAIFLRQWETYRKIVGHNYMFHAQVYDCLRGLLTEPARRPFRLIDIACGDASWTVKAAEGTRIAHYCGVDISQPALHLAAEQVKKLSCPSELIQGDFIDAVRDWTEPVDIVWIGQSLHHLRGVDKLPFMCRLHRLIDVGGLLAIWEPTTLEGEDRAGWLRRFETGTRPLWSAISPEEWDAMVDHIRDADYPETLADWHSLGLDAGFASVEDVFTAPTNLARVYCYRA